jgi:hypothetical protein
MDGQIAGKKCGSREVLTGMRVWSTRKKTVPPPWQTVPDVAASLHATSPLICRRR